MDIQKLVDYSKKNILPVEGNFPEKPYGYNSLIGWLKKGYRPTDIENGGTIYKMYNKQEGYKYFSSKEVVPLTEDEKAQVSKIYGNEVKVEKVKEKEPTQIESTDTNNRLMKNFFKEHKNIISIKVETTGFYPDNGAEILRLSIVDRNKVLFDQIFKPHHTTDWKDTEKFHGITPEITKFAPYPEYVRDYVQDIIDKSDGIVFYNASFNLEFLRKGMKLEVPEDKIINTYEIFKVHKPFLYSHRLGDAINVYLKNQKIETLYKKQKGHSSYDALTTLIVYETMKKTIAQEQRAFEKEKAQEQQTEEEEGYDR